MSLLLVKKELQVKTNPSKIKIYSNFFKTGKGEYGEGDKFLGITVPEQRSIAKKYLDLSLDDIESLLQSDIHEHRLTSLLILVEQYKKASETEKEKIVTFYLKNAQRVNNWDLVDLTAPNILGPYLINKDKKILYTLSKSSNLWEKRIAIVATLAFIRKEEFEDTLKISELYLNEKHDLLQKATGWMLREMGKKNEQVLEEFLQKNFKNMPRTMLRYSIERLSKERREFYMKKN